MQYNKRNMVQMRLFLSTFVETRLFGKKMPL